MSAPSSYIAQNAKKLAHNVATSFVSFAVEFVSRRVDALPYQQLAKLEEKLDRSESERRDLEIKFNQLLQSSKNEEQDRLNKLKEKYNDFLNDCKQRSLRNDSILKSLQKIESGANSVYAKTERLKQLRIHYEAYLSRVIPLWRHPQLSQYQAIQPLPEYGQWQWTYNGKKSISPVSPVMHEKLTSPVRRVNKPGNYDVRDLRWEYIHSFKPIQGYPVARGLGQAGQRMMAELAVSRYSPPNYENLKVFDYPKYIPKYVPHIVAKPYSPPRSGDLRSKEPVIVTTNVKPTPLIPTPEIVVPSAFKPTSAYDEMRMGARRAWEKIMQDPSLMREFSYESLQDKPKKVGEIERSATVENYIEPTLSDDEMIDNSLLQKLNSIRNNNGRLSKEAAHQSNEPKEFRVAEQEVYNNRLIDKTNNYQPSPKAGKLDEGKKVAIAHQKSIEELKAMLSPDEDLAYEQQYNEGNYSFTEDEDVPEEFNEPNDSEPRYQGNVLRNVILEEDEPEENETNGYADSPFKRKDWREGVIPREGEQFLPSRPENVKEYTKSVKYEKTEPVNQFMPSVPDVIGVAKPHSENYETSSQGYVSHPQIKKAPSRQEFFVPPRSESIDIIPRHQAVTPKPERGEALPSQGIPRVDKNEPPQPKLEDSFQKDKMLSLISSMNQLVKKKENPVAASPQQSDSSRGSPSSIPSRTSSPKPNLVESRKSPSLSKQLSKDLIKPKQSPTRSPSQRSLRQGRSSPLQQSTAKQLSRSDSKSPLPGQTTKGESPGSRSSPPRKTADENLQKQVVIKTSSPQPGQASPPLGNGKKQQQHLSPEWPPQGQQFAESSEQDLYIDTLPADVHEEQNPPMPYYRDVIFDPHDDQQRFSPPDMNIPEHGYQQESQQQHQQQAYENYAQPAVPYYDNGDFQENQGQYNVPGFENGTANDHPEYTNYEDNPEATGNAHYDPQYNQPAYANDGQYEQQQQHYEGNQSNPDGYAENDVDPARYEQYQGDYPYEHQYPAEAYEQTEQPNQMYDYDPASNQAPQFYEGQAEQYDPNYYQGQGENYQGYENYDPSTDNAAVENTAGQKVEDGGDQMNGKQPGKPSVLSQLIDSDSESYRVEPAAGAGQDDSDFDFSAGK